MGYVRDKLLPPLLRLLERVRHRVECQRKVVDLAGIFVGLLGAKFGFSVAEPARHIRHLAERPDKRARQEGRRNERQAQRCDCRIEKERAAAEHVVRRLVHGCGHNNEAHKVPCRVVYNRLSGQKALVLINIRQLHVFFIVHAVSQHLPPVALWHLLSHMVARQAVARADDNVSVLIADERTDLSDFGKKRQPDLEIPVALECA